MKILVTGGAGFIGSALCRHLIANGHHVYNIDKLTYAGNLESLTTIINSPHYHFYRLDISDREQIHALLDNEQMDAVMHLAAESHVDRSISGPQTFIATNIVGTFQLLEAVRQYWEKLPPARKETFRFHHISTDEVFGDLPFDQGIFTEKTPYCPSSPYSASKAASDHLVRAWGHTYGLPVVLSHCSNNYGPYHFPEKLIPLVIFSAIAQKPLPIYGKGDNIRDWLYVEDHANALETIVLNGKIGESYNVGGKSERTNLQVVRSICDILDKLKPRKNDHSYSDLISFVTDRKGHDRRYAIDPTKIETELGWRAKETFETGLEKTVNWFLDNEWWWLPLVERAKLK